MPCRPTIHLNLKLFKVYLNPEENDDAIYISIGTIITKKVLDIHDEIINMSIWVKETCLPIVVIMFLQCLKGVGNSISTTFNDYIY